MIMFQFPLNKTHDGYIYRDENFPFFPEPKITFFKMGNGSNWFKKIY